MYILVLLVFINPGQVTKDQFHFANQVECQRVSELLKTVSKFRIISNCQQVV